MSNKIINFHEVRDSAWFENVVVYLKNNYTMIGLHQLYDFYYNSIALKNACLITVDDGHISSYNIIYPVLKKYNIPAIFFVSPKIAQRNGDTNFWFQEIGGYEEEKMIHIINDVYGIEYDRHASYIDNLRKLGIDLLWKVINSYQKQYKIEWKEPQNMTIEQIRQIDQEHLVEIGAHTMTHPFLAVESTNRSIAEITSSIELIEEILQHPIQTFAYPNGIQMLDFGQREMDVMKGTSIKLAFSTNARNISKKDDVYSIPRYGLSCGSLFFIKMKLWLGKYYLPLSKVLKNEWNAFKLF